MKTCVKGVVSGVVQGVFFRKHVQSAALRYQVNGYAKNLADGSVEVLLLGEREQVGQVKHAVEQGSPHSRVDGVVWSESDESLPVERREGFTVC